MFDLVHSYNPASKLQRIVKSIVQKKALIEDYVQPEVISYFSTKQALCSGKVLRVESLANLVNRLQFAKQKPFKVVVTINNPLADQFICQTFYRQTLGKSKSTKCSPCQTFQL